MIIFKKILFFKTIFIVIFLSNSLIAQNEEFELTFYYNPMNSNEYWWLTKNNFGITDLQSKIEFSLESGKNTYSMNILNDNTGTFHLGPSFIKHSFSEKSFIRIGKYYRDFSQYLNDSLSSGHMLISQNAEPLPKIGYVFSKKINNVNFNFGISHAFFGKDNFYLKAPYLHEKFVYLNTQKNDYEFSIGLVHEAIWAGKTPTLDFSSSLSNYWKIFISSDGDKAIGHQNSEGSHIGIWDFLIQKTNTKNSLKIYYQHIFEDTSGIRFANRFDGLWGMEFIDHIRDLTFLIEYLDTSNQYRDPPYVQELYYGNYQYRPGWSFNNYNLGNPFIKRPNIEDYPNWFVDSPNVIHFASSGKLLSSYYQVMLSRRTNINDKIKYKIVVGRKMKNDLDLKLFFANNDNKIGSGLIISRQF